MPLVSKAFGDIITFTRASSATFTGSNGLIQSAAIDAPRFDYDPVTLVAKGLLIEEARTNLPTYSEDFSNAAWAPARSSVSSNATSAPDGNTTADKLVEDTSLGTHIVGRSTSIAITANTTYTASCFLKAAERTIAQCRMRLGGINASAEINLTTGAVSAVTGEVPTSFSASAVGNGWYRVIVTATGDATATADINIRLCDAAGSNSYTGNGTSGIFIWGTQLEAGAFATSYIPTVASQVTRSADVASVNTLSPWFNATEGTLFASVSGFSVGTTSSALASITDNPTASNWILISGLSTTAAGVVSGGASQANLTSLPSVSSGGSVAIAYKANDFAAVVNGGTVATDVSGSVPSSVSVLRIGGFGSNPGPLNGHIRRITYYPTRLSNAQLQAITA